MYPQWGDMDQARGSIEIRRHADAFISYLSERYSNAVTVEADDSSCHFGKRKGGRLLLRRAPEDNQTHIESYDMDIDIFQDLELQLMDRVDI